MADLSTEGSVRPLCPYFGECGGCKYQHLSYAEELLEKEKQLQEYLQDAITNWQSVKKPVVASPQEYHYRHRLDLRLLKTKEQKIFVGFSPIEKFGVVDVDQCPIAMKAVGSFIPELKKQAAAILPQKYRLANLVVRCGDDGRVFWGGIGKRSLEQNQEDYFWTELNGLKIYYALDTFFQANLSILPKLFEIIRQLPLWSDNVTFLDLYGGVGLFSLGLHGSYGQSVLIEDSKNSIRLARYNVETHGLSNVTVIEGRVEDYFEDELTKVAGPLVAMIDPPRAGLSDSACTSMMQAAEYIPNMLYLSCNPEALGRDLKKLTDSHWKVEEVRPFDFFPKTRHVETLVWLRSLRKE